MRNLLIIIVLSTCSIILSACSSPENNEKKNVQSMPVRVLTVEPTNLPVAIDAVGRLIPFRQVALASEIGGVIQAYNVDVGDKITTEQILATITPTDYRLSLEKAMANLASAKARLNVAAKIHERSKILLPRKVITTDEFDRNEAEFKAAKASVSLAKAMVDIEKQQLIKTEIRSPFSGFIAARMIEIGQTVTVGYPVFNISDLSSMRVVIHLSELDYVHLDPEDEVVLTVEAFPGVEFKGRIHRIGIQANNSTNTFEVEILVKNRELQFKAGFSARVHLVVEVIKNTILIPQSSVLYRENRQEVFLVDADDYARAQRVKLGRTKGHLVQIKDGIKAGDCIVVSGGEYIKNGEKVRIIETEKSEGS